MSYLPFRCICDVYVTLGFVYPLLHTKPNVTYTSHLSKIVANSGAKKNFEANVFDDVLLSLKTTKNIS